MACAAQVARRKRASSDLDGVESGAGDDARSRPRAHGGTRALSRRGRERPRLEGEGSIGPPLDAGGLGVVDHGPGGVLKRSGLRSGLLTRRGEVNKRA